MLREIRRWFIGRPLHNQEAAGEKLPKWKALAIFSSDALSSVGYGPEQIVIALSIPGLLLYGYFSYAFLAVVALLSIVTLSYAQVARANPGGGGSYSVAKTNLGELPALVAASALFADYVLTVAVSISSGTEALTSAFPSLVGKEVAIDIFVLVAILTLINLRGVRESSNVFVIPTYLFILGMGALIAVGLFQAFMGNAPLLPRASVVRQEISWATFAIVLRAFANGCSSMTGIEAISNGIPMFRHPEHINAIKTTYLMAGLLTFMLAGTSFLLLHYHIMPVENVTVLSQIAEMTFGRGWMYYYIQITTMLILYLAANTSYNGLPPLLSLLARDGYMPRYLGLRGERLSFSNGIMLLSFIAGLLIISFEGNVEHLISLYAIGVFLSFTIAQTGLILFWKRVKGSQWVMRSIANGIGAITTGLVVIVIAVSKFFYGAWIILVFIPVMIFILKKIKGHYADMAEFLRLPAKNERPVCQKRKHIVVVPVSSPTSVIAATLEYAEAIGDTIIALHISVDEVYGKKFEEEWKNWRPDIQLITIYSPYRMVIQPLLDFVETLHREKNPGEFITVIIPEFKTKKWWHRLLHNQTGLILRMLLIVRENVVVTTISYHLDK